MIKLMCPRMKFSGGPGIFMNRLLTYMQEHDMVKMVDSNPDVYFATIWLGKPPKRCKSVYRAGSVYYDAHEKKRKGVNKKIAHAITTADHVVYQTNFAKRLCEKVLTRLYDTPVAAKSSSIIYNGFNKDGLDAVVPFQKDAKHLFFASGNWERKIKRGSWIVKAFDAAAIPDSHLVLAGHIRDEDMNDYKTQNNQRITTLGKVDFPTVVSYLKANPIFVHLCHIESGPNSVIEALSFGCPVVCNNIGATPEIVGKDGIIAECDKGFKCRRQPINLAIKNFDSVVDALRMATTKEWTVNRSDDFSMKKCAKEYLRVFKSVLGDK